MCALAIFFWTLAGTWTLSEVMIFSKARETQLRFGAKLGTLRWGFFFEHRALEQRMFAIT